MQIEGKVAVVTGGASGLGLATVEALIERGAHGVGIFDLNQELGDAAVARSGGKAIFCKVDVTDEAQVNAGIAEVIKGFGAIHFNVNCAGIGVAAKTVGKGQACPLDHFTSVINVNLIGTFNVLRLAAVEMLKNEPVGESGERGAIVNTASVAAFDGQMGQVAYAASKAGVVGMSLPIARDFSRNGIRCNVIAPGLFETPMVGGLSPQVRERIEQGVEYPKRFGEPREYAELACTMLEMSYLNAECVRLDAGTRLPPR